MSERWVGSPAHPAHLHDELQQAAQPVHEAGDTVAQPVRVADQHGGVGRVHRIEPLGGRRINQLEVQGHHAQTPPGHFGHIGNVQGVPSGRHRRSMLRAVL